MSKQKEEKTNVMRVLDQKKVPYTAHTYPVGDAAPDGVSVAQMLGQDPAAVFKTLVVKGASGGYYVFDIPAAETLDRLRQKYAKLQTVEKLRQENNFLFALLARAVGILPGDVVSLYFGAVRLPFGPYLAGSLLGLCPTMVAVTIMGGNVSDPFSPAFLAAAGIDLLVVAVSFVVCKRILRKKQ